jgi:hypothetical protein
MASEAVTGSCLCGSVKFEIRPPYSAFRYCHCSRCRKASGSAHAANLFLPEGQFRWTAGEALVKQYKLPGARTFALWSCSRCGSRVPHRIEERTEFLIPAGTLDSDPAMRPENIIFWGSKAPWYVEPQSIAKFDERP